METALEQHTVIQEFGGGTLEKCDTYTESIVISARLNVSFTCLQASVGTLCILRIFLDLTSGYLVRWWLV